VSEPVEHFVSAMVTRQRLSEFVDALRVDRTVALLRDIPRAREIPIAESRRYRPGERSRARSNSRVSMRDRASGERTR
jgi:hypothetical protein